jgi:ATP-dependent helicase HrpA
MNEEDLLARDPDTEKIALYPETVSAGGWRLDCLYRFEPGNKEDGVTLRIPVHAVYTVPAASLDWAVPGLLREKVLALLKGLPKEYRKQLMPLARTAEVILAEMDREGVLITALGRFIYKRFGVDVPADRWPVEELEEHLKMRFAVVDEKERELASGRDPAILKQGFVEEVESKAFAGARRTWEKTGLTAWTIGDLPERITLTGKGPHTPVVFPALNASESGVGIRLFRSEAEARLSHLAGVKALLALHFRDELRHLRKGIVPTGDLKVWAAAFGGVKALENAILEKVMHDLFEKEIRTAAGFVAHADAICSMILPRGQEVLRMVLGPMKALFDATEQLRTLESANRVNRPLLAFLSTLRTEIALLLPTDFLICYDNERIGHIGRYLRALSLRAERGAVHLEKALERGKEVDALTAWLEELRRDLPPHASPEKQRALEAFRWMIEEYKISLFAQEIKTAGPVSRKRIDARMGEIQRML